MDALDEQAVSAHAERVRKAAGSLDVSFNLINIQELQDVPLIEMAVDDFVRPVQTAMRTQFLTATAAGRIMVAQRSGVILSLSATPGGIGYPRVVASGLRAARSKPSPRTWRRSSGPNACAYSTSARLVRQTRVRFAKRASRAVSGCKSSSTRSRPTPC